MATATYLPPPFYKDHSENRSYVPEPPGCSSKLRRARSAVPQIYPKDSNVDYKKELRSLNRELQLHVLELADVLVERPSQYAKRIGDISSIFKNLHHLLDSLRPQQARATLIHIMELQFQQRKQAVEDIKRRREVQRLLKDAFITLDGQ
ncbi:Mediator of RNA polymerase II transcription subunit 7b [Raphanus sativus]|nr:Mediator of RNA polymerase II transcription subunit 7b [Raphanus sativus]